MRLPLAVLMAACVCAADNYPRQPGIDVQHYVFRITLNDDNDEIAGETTVDVRAVKDGVAELVLDLASPNGGKGMIVQEVVTPAAAARYTHRADRLSIPLSPPARAGQRLAFTIRYRGVPADGLRIVRNKYGERTFFSANWPDKARQWLPTIDHPYDKATSEFIVTAPAQYQVVANGVLQEVVDLGGGRRRTHWKQAEPIATWLNNIGVARFATRYFGAAAGVPLSTWVFPQDRDAGIVTLEAPMRQSVEFFSSHVGPYPYDKLAGVQNGASNGGGMEHASAIFYGQNVINGRPALGLVAHETAHQWFGDAVTEKDWDDVWLSEGFATYFSALAIEHYEGREAFVAVLQRSRATAFTAEKRLPGVAVVQDKPWTGIPNGIVYQKGGWSLHMLRGQIGTEKFWAGIREYYRRYRDANASTAEFQQVMEEATGADLGWFFRQWLYRAGSPVIEGGWSYNAASKSIGIDLAQRQPGDPYRLPLEIGIAVEGAPLRIEKIEMTAKQQHFEIATEKPPSTVELDPNTWVLVDGKFAKR